MQESFPDPLTAVTRRTIDRPTKGGRLIAGHGAKENCSIHKDSFNLFNLFFMILYRNRHKTIPSKDKNGLWWNPDHGHYCLSGSKKKTKTIRIPAIELWRNCAGCGLKPDYHDHEKAIFICHKCLAIPKNKKPVKVDFVHGRSEYQPKGEYPPLSAFGCTKESEAELQY